MAIILLIIIILLLKSLKINIREEIFTRETTGSINALFIYLVFVSHFKNYTTFSSRMDLIIVDLTLFIGQLMVVTFLFFSGYGLLSSIINDKSRSISIIKMKNRLFKVWLNFAIAVTIYIFFNLIIGNKFLLSTILSSYIAWDTVGNSAWYMFGVFSLYIILIISLYLTKSDEKLVFFVFILTSILFYVLSLLKDPYWYNTLLCFPLGMLIKLYESNIKKFAQKYFYLLLFLSIILFAFLKRIAYVNSLIYTLMAYSVLIIMTIVSTKYSFNNKFLVWISSYIFEIYIYQRLFFSIFSPLAGNSNLYFLASLIMTFTLSIAMNGVCKKIYKTINF